MNQEPTLNEMYFLCPSIVLFLFLPLLVLPVRVILLVLLVFLLLLLLLLLLLAYSSSCCVSCLCSSPSHPQPQHNTSQPTAPRQQQQHFNAIQKCWLCDKVHAAYLAPLPPSKPQPILLLAKNPQVKYTAN